MRRVLTGLMVWTGTAVLVALLASRVLKVRSAELDRQARLDRLARPVSKANRGPLVRQEYPDPRADPGTTSNSSPSTNGHRSTRT